MKNLSTYKFDELKLNDEGIVEKIKEKGNLGFSKTFCFRGFYLYTFSSIWNPMKNKMRKYRNHQKHSWHIKFTFKKREIIMRINRLPKITNSNLRTVFNLEKMSLKLSVFTINIIFTTIIEKKRIDWKSIVKKD